MHSRERPDLSASDLDGPPARRAREVGKLLYRAAMKPTIKRVLSVVFGGLLLLGAGLFHAACSSKTCSTSEEQACTSTYTDCVNKAAAAADKAACQKCI